MIKKLKAVWPALLLFVVFEALNIYLTATWTPWFATGASTLVGMLGGLLIGIWAVILLDLD